VKVQTQWIYNSQKSSCSTFVTVKVTITAVNTSIPSCSSWVLALTSYVGHLQLSCSNKIFKKQSKNWHGVLALWRNMSEHITRCTKPTNVLQAVELHFIKRRVFFSFSMFLYSDCRMKTAGDQKATVWSWNQFVYLHFTSLLYQVYYITNLCEMFVWIQLLL